MQAIAWLRVAADNDVKEAAAILNGELPKLSPRVIGLAWHRDRYRMPAADAFIQTAQSVCRELELEPLPV